MKPTERFSSRVADYVRYRPSYPSEVFDLLRAECGLAPGVSVADIGSGTGIFSRPLLERGAEVFGVEPNADMRNAADDFIGQNENFHSVAATAEHTTLADHSVDLITCAQAFHWFDHVAVMEEFRRILKPGGCLFLVWNERKATPSAFLREYEQALREYCPEYLKVDHRNVQASDLSRFFKEMKRATFANQQMVDEEGFLGRASSSSYAPNEGQPRYEEFYDELRRLFALHHVRGMVALDYDTECYYGSI